MMEEHGYRKWPFVVLLLMAVLRVIDSTGTGTAPSRPYTGVTTFLPFRPSTPGLRPSTADVSPGFRTTPGTPVAQTSGHYSVSDGRTVSGGVRPQRPSTPGSTINVPTINPPLTFPPLPTTTATTVKLQPQFTDAPGDGSNLTGSNICVRQVTETRYAWQTVTFACQRKTTVRCFTCTPTIDCTFLNATHCERQDAGTCSATVYQYQPVDVTIKECCIGFEQVGNQCHRIKACENGNGGCSQLCRKNPVSGLYCECFNGYILEKNGTTCVDWDECQANNGGCSHTCSNTPGSFYCTCQSGFTLRSSPFICEEVNECENYNGGCAQKCINLIGRHYCECEEGYTLKHGTDCEKVKQDNTTERLGPRTDAEVLTSIPMIATLASVGALVIIVLMIWVICCYLKGPCWCCASNSSNNTPKKTNRRDESIVMHYRGTGEGKDKEPPPYYNNGYVSGGSDSSDYNTNARRPNGLPDKEVIMEGDIHILGE